MTPSLEFAVQSLSRLLAEENAALASMDFGRAGALLAPKHAAADALAAAWRAAASDELPRAQLAELGALADENRRLLNRAMRVQKRVLDLVTRAARGTQPAMRYGAGGRAAHDAAAPRRLATRA
jgi:hypothetical protein